MAKDIRRSPKFEFEPKRGAGGVKPVSYVGPENAGELTKDMLRGFLNDFKAYASEVDGKVRELLAKKAVRIDDDELAAAMSDLAAAAVEPVVSYTAYLAAQAQNTKSSKIVSEAYRSFSLSLYGDAALIFADMIMSFRREADRMLSYLDITGELNQDVIQSIASTIAMMSLSLDSIVDNIAIEYDMVKSEIGEYLPEEFVEVLKSSQALIDHNVAIVNQHASRLSMVLDSHGDKFYTNTLPRMQEAAAVPMTDGAVGELAVIGADAESVERSSAIDDYLQRMNIISVAAVNLIDAVDSIRGIQAVASSGVEAAGIAPHPSITLTTPEEDVEAALIGNNDISIDSLLQAAYSDVPELPDDLVHAPELQSVIDQMVAVEAFNQIADLFVYGDKIEFDGANIKAGTIDVTALKVGNVPMAMSVTWAENMASYHPETGLDPDENYHLAHTAGHVTLDRNGVATPYSIDAEEVLLEDGVTPLFKPEAPSDPVEYNFWIFFEVDDDTRVAKFIARQMDSSDGTYGRPVGDDIYTIGVFDTSGTSGRLFTSYGVTVINGGDIVTRTISASQIVIDNGLLSTKIGQMEQATVDAQVDADAANALIADISSDDKLTPSEKSALRKEWDELVAEHVQLDAQADTYGTISAIDTAQTNLDTAYTALGDYLNGSGLVISPDLQPAHQGYTTDGTYHYIIHTDQIRKYDAGWTLIAQNTTPFTGMTGVSHLGHGNIYNGKLYVACETYGAPSTNMRVCIYDATTLQLDSWFSVAGQMSEISAVIAVPAWGGIFCTNFNDSSKLWKYDITTKAYVGTLSMTGVEAGIQGITYYNNLFYVSTGGSANAGKIYSWNPNNGAVALVMSSTRTGWHEGFAIVGGRVRWLVDNAGGTPSNALLYDIAMTSWSAGSIPSLISDANLAVTTSLGSGGGAQMRLRFKDYYEKRQLLYKSISDQARTETDAKPNITYGAVAPSNPRTNDIWVDTNPRVSGNLSKVARASNVVTITTSASHGLSAGQVISINAADNAFDLTDVIVTTTPSATTLTVAQAGADVAEKADAGTWSAKSMRLTKVWNGTAWVVSGDILYPGKTTINGGLLETDTILVDRIKGVGAGGTRFPGGLLTIDSAVQFSSGYDPTTLAPGGTNKLKNSSFETTMGYAAFNTNWSLYLNGVAAATASELTASPPGFPSSLGKCYRLVVTNAGNAGLGDIQIYNSTAGNFGIRNGQVYMFSFWVRCTVANVQFYLGIYKNGSPYTAYSNVAMVSTGTANTWTKITTLLTANADASDARINFRLGGTGAAGGSHVATFDFDFLKLEEGNQATPWSPHHDEMAVYNLFNDGTTVINGGRIDTDTLIAKKIQTSVSGTRIEINTAGNVNRLAAYSGDSGELGPAQFVGVKGVNASNPTYTQATPPASPSPYEIWHNTGADYATPSGNYVVAGSTVQYLYHSSMAMWDWCDTGTPLQNIDPHLLIDSPTTANGGVEMKLTPTSIAINLGGGGGATPAGGDFVFKLLNGNPAIISPDPYSGLQHDILEYDAWNDVLTISPDVTFSGTITGGSMTGTFRQSGSATNIGVGGKYVMTANTTEGSTATSWRAVPIANGLNYVTCGAMSPGDWVDIWSSLRVASATNGAAPKLGIGVYNGNTSSGTLLHRYVYDGGGTVQSRNAVWQCDGTYNDVRVYLMATTDATSSQITFHGGSATERYCWIAARKWIG